jgi:CheY-like chemotaxis protein
MRRLTIHTFILLLLLAASTPSFCQDKALQDSLEKRLNLLRQLSQEENYEEAAVEVESFRKFLKHHQMLITPKALVQISGIYKANSDELSATLLLQDAFSDANNDPNPVTKAALLKALADECKRWEMYDMAFKCQERIIAVNDSIAALRRRAELIDLQQKMDSIVALRQQELAEQTKHFPIERDKALMWVGVVALLFLGLLYSYFRNHNQWRSLLEKKELEWDMLRTNLQREAEERAFAQAAEAAEAAKSPEPVPAPTAVVAAPPPPTDPYQIYHGPKPEQIALLIEPNRQVVLYMKSLLSDRFQIETAATPSEGLQMANDLLPDLIVCDAVLNGRTGIEIARQIKLSERTNHIPVVLLTDKFGNEGKLDALRAGAEAWFSRPVIDDEFDASVQRLLDVRKQKHEQFNRFLQLYFTDNRIPLEDPFLLRSVQMIEENLANPNYLPDDMARKLQLTKTHYAKKLKVLTGKEPVQLIREMRLEKAKVLLEKRAGNPQAISELVGFTSPGTFSLAFKEYFGENTLLLYTPPSNRLN